MTPHPNADPNHTGLWVPDAWLTGLRQEKAKLEARVEELEIALEEAEASIQARDDNIAMLGGVPECNQCGATMWALCSDWICDNCTKFVATEEVPDEEV